MEARLGPMLDTSLASHAHIQLRVLRVMQQIAEEACFAFAQRHLPWLLNERQWACAEAVELQQWARALPHSLMHEVKPNIAKEIVDWDAVNRSTSDAPLERPLTMWRDLTDLRNSAVHRRTMAPATLMGLVDAAGSLMRLLKDIKRRDWFDELRRELDDAVRNPDGGMRAVGRFVSEQHMNRPEELHNLVQKEVIQISDSESDGGLANDSCKSPRTAPGHSLRERKLVPYKSSPDKQTAPPLSKRAESRAQPVGCGLEAAKASGIAAKDQFNPNFGFMGLQGIDGRIRGWAQLTDAGSETAPTRAEPVQLALHQNRPSRDRLLPPEPGRPAFGQTTQMQSARLGPDAASSLAERTKLGSFWERISPSKPRGFGSYTSVSGADTRSTLPERLRRPDRMVSRPGSSKCDPIVLDDGSPERAQRTRATSASGAPRANADVEEYRSKQEEKGTREAEEDIPWWDYVLARL